MDKHEILERNKKSKFPDEGEQYANDKARSFGVIGFASFLVLILIINLVRGVKSFDLLSILWAYSAFESFSRYRYSKKNSHLLGTIASGVAAVCFFISYLLSVFVG